MIRLFVSKVSVANEINKSEVRIIFEPYIVKKELPDSPVVASTIN